MSNAEDKDKREAVYMVEGIAADEPVSVYTTVEIDCTNTEPKV
jgi:hypothetical protein